MQNLSLTAACVVSENGAGQEDARLRFIVLCKL